MDEFIEKFEETYNIKFSDWPPAFINTEKLGNNYEYIATILLKILSLIEMKRIFEEKKENEIIEKYKKKIKELYKYEADNQVAHGLRDELYDNVLRELGYEELADLLEKAEKDIGFWYA